MSVLRRRRDERPEPVRTTAELDRLHQLADATTRKAEEGEEAIARIRDLIRDRSAGG